MKILIVGSGGREHAIAWKAVSYTHLDVYKRQEQQVERDGTFLTNYLMEKYKSQ